MISKLNGFAVFLEISPVMGGPAHVHFMVKKLDLQLLCVPAGGKAYIAWALAFQQAGSRILWLEKLCLKNSTETPFFSRDCAWQFV